MNWFFKWLLTPVLFWQMPDQRFVKIEIQYLVWCVACFFAVLRVAHSIENGYPETFGGMLLSFVFYLPFLFMVFLVIRAWIYPSIHTLFDIPKKWWISRLSLSYKKWHPLSVKEFELQEELKERFVRVYDEEFGKGRMHWLHKLQFVILIASFFLGYLLGK